MKVLYIASGTGMAGGATKSLIAMLLQAKKHGIEVEVICPDHNGLTVWLRENGIKTHVVAFRHSRLPFFRTPADKLKWLPRLVHDSWINFRARSAVRRIAKAFAPDIIHENSSVIDVGYHASKALGIPDVVHIREYGDLDFHMTLPGRMRRLRAPHVSSISITKDICRHLNQDSNPKATQIYDGIVLCSDFRIDTDKEKWFLYAGRIERAKGIDDLLEAYVEYFKRTENPYPLYVCGGCNNPAFLEEMKSYASDNGIGPHVVWLGERSDVADFMAKATATVIPSRFEGLGRVMPEAMANGSLCIARYTGGTKEQLDNGMKFTGAPIAIPYQERQELIDALLKVTEASEKGEAFGPDSQFMRMIGRAQDAVKEFFSEESFGRKVVDFYDRVLIDSNNPSLSLQSK